MTEKSCGITVVITTVERPEKLRRSIRSVINQQYSPLQLVLVIDGGSKISNKVAEEFTELDLLVINNNVSVGGAQSRNIGINIAKYQYIALLDDDDEWLDGKLKKQMRFMNKQKSYQAVSFTSLLTYVRNENHKYKLPKEKYDGTTNIPNYLFTQKGLGWNGFIQTSTIVSTKRIFQNYPFDSQLPKHQDWDWIIRVSESGVPVIHLDEPLTIYHKNSNNSVAQNPNWQFSEKWINRYRQFMTKEAIDDFYTSVINNNISKDPKLSIIKRYRLIHSNERKYEFRQKLSLAFIRYRAQYIYNMLKIRKNR